jgi:hypothetical protein
MVPCPAAVIRRPGRALANVLKALGLTPQRVQQVVDQLVLNATHDDRAGYLLAR